MNGKPVGRYFYLDARTDEKLRVTAFRQQRLQNDIMVEAIAKALAEDDDEDNGEFIRCTLCHRDDVVRIDEITDMVKGIRGRRKRAHAVTVLCANWRCYRCPMPDEE